MALELPLNTCGYSRLKGSVTDSAWTRSRYSMTCGMQPCRQTATLEIHKMQEPLPMVHGWWKQAIGLAASGIGNPTNQHWHVSWGFLLSPSNSRSNLARGISSSVGRKDRDVIVISSQCDSYYTYSVRMYLQVQRLSLSVVLVSTFGVFLNELLSPWPLENCTRVTWCPVQHTYVH